MSRRGIHDDDGLRRSGRKSNKKFDNLDLAQIAGSSEFEYMMREANRRLNRSRGHNDADDEIPMRHSERVSKRRRITVEEEDIEAVDMDPSDEEDEKPRSSRIKTSRVRSPSNRKSYNTSLNISGQSRDRSRYEDTDEDQEETTTFEITSTVKRKRKQTDFFSPVPEASTSAYSLRRGRSSAMIMDEDSNQSYPDTTENRSQHRSPVSRRTRTLSNHERAPENEEDTNGLESETGEESSNESEPKKYNLRERATVSYQDNLPDPVRKSGKDKDGFQNYRSRRQDRRKNQIAFLSPAHRRFSKKTSRRKLDSLGSSTSESEDEGGEKGDRDEARFEKRKTKSLERARDRFLPMNMDPKDARKGVLRDRIRAVGSSCTDIDPMGIDRSIGFESVGGLQHHIQGLKEMIVFPMLYPSVFEKFNLQPPRGVIFYGPPGTGKTLVARALANETSKGDKKVSFFMRKGADCLSKWVGESERQLRLLFDQAYTMRPSIIFFDELDGLAPVRSTRQDQIHSSIVSTLLALMDGLDGRGEVVVIGATNRLDSLDPALRRPGRFDRELRFSLPDREARTRILSIHTSKWDPPLDSNVIARVAEKTVGFCGADLKGVCTEAALISLRQSFPQIYCTNDRLQLDLQNLSVTEKDFDLALGKMVPASRRNLETQTKPLQSHISCYLDSKYQKIVSDIIPKGYFRVSEQLPPGATKSEQYSSVIKALESGHRVAGTRLLICAQDEGYGQTSHLAPAVLHALDHLPINSLAIQNIFSETSFKSPEEAVSTILRSAARAGSESGGAGGPSILFLPAIDVWFNIVSPTVWHVLASIIQSWDVMTPVLFLATAHCNFEDLPEDLQYLFRTPQVVTLDIPSEEERTSMFHHLFIERTKKEPRSFTKKVFKELPIAPAEDRSKKLSEAEKKILDKQDAAVLRELRIFLREILARLIRDRRFGLFAKPVDREEVPDYYQVIKNPMDLSLMMNKIDRHLYSTVEAFMADIDLICQNALEYNPDFEIEDKTIRHRACALRDAALALIEDELDPEFERRMQELKEGREARGAPPCPEAPHPFLFAQPKGAQNQQPGYLQEDEPKRYQTRSSRPAPNPMDSVESSAAESVIVNLASSEESLNPTTSKEFSKAAGHSVEKVEPVAEEAAVVEESLNCSKGSTGSGKKRRKGSVWCRPHKRRRVSLNSQQRRKILHQRSAAIKKKYINQMGKPSSTAGSLCSSPTKEPSLPLDQMSLPRTASEKSSNSPLPEPPVLSVPEEELEKLVPLAVAKTKKWRLNELERIYCALSEVVEEFEEEWDRSALPERLRDRLKRIGSVDDV